MLCVVDFVLVESLLCQDLAACCGPTIVHYLSVFSLFLFMVSGSEDYENITESIVAEGLVEVRRGGIKPSE
jgi:hypothetical protein